MPPAKKTHEDSATLKEKLHALPGPTARGRRNGGAAVTNGSHLKEVMSSTADNASTHSGQNEQNGSSGVSQLMGNGREDLTRTALADTMLLDSYPGTHRTVPSSKDTDGLTASTPRRPSKILSRTSYSRTGSVASRPQWHGPSRNEECKRNNWLWL
jgi:hypothetical protein